MRHNITSLNLALNKSDEAKKYLQAAEESVDRNINIFNEAKLAI